MTYRNMKKRIAMLEQDTNDVDYPEDVIKKMPWTFSYMNDLYERSVNGARSPKAIAYLKKVTNTIYVSIIALIVAAAVVIGLVAFLCGRSN